MNIKKYIFPINNGVLYMIKYAFLLCTICGLLIGIENYNGINKSINGFGNLLRSDDFQFEISNNKLNFNNSEYYCVVNGIQYYINDNYNLAEANEIKDIKISSTNYILFLRDGIQCNAGIIGMNDHLDSQKYYNELPEEYLNNENLLKKIPFIKSALAVLIIIESILFSFFEFLSQVFFMSLIIYFIDKIFTRKNTKIVHDYKTIFKLTLYSAFFPKIFITIIKFMVLSIEITPIMLFTFIIYNLLIYNNKLQKLPITYCK